MNQSGQNQLSTIRFSFNGVPGTTVVSPTNRGSVGFRSTLQEQPQPIRSTLQQPSTLINQVNLSSSRNQCQSSMKVEPLWKIIIMGIK